MRISDWSSDVCSSDLRIGADLEVDRHAHRTGIGTGRAHVDHVLYAVDLLLDGRRHRLRECLRIGTWVGSGHHHLRRHDFRVLLDRQRSEEHTSELQSLMRTSYAVFCLKKNKTP